MDGMIQLLAYLIVIGVLLWLFNQFVTMDSRFKTAINVLVCLFAFLYILSAFGLISLPNVRR